MSVKLSETEKEMIKSKVVEALRNVYDPEIPVNVYDLGLVYRVDVADDGQVEVDMTLTAPGCPIATMILSSAEASIRENVPEIKGVKVRLVWDPPWNPLRVTPEGREALKKLFGYDVVEEWIQRYRQ